MESPASQARLLELIGLLREGHCDAQTMGELETILDGDPEAISYFVQSSELHAALNRRQWGLEDAFVPTVTEVSAPVPPPPLRRQFHNWLVSGICAGLLLGMIFGGWRSLAPESALSESPSVDQVIVEAPQEVATLNFAVNCVWQNPRYEGQRLETGMLELLQGIAVIRLDSEVSLTIEGPTRLELVSVDRTKLHQGKAVYRAAGSMNGFITETPFYEIVDEGTEYAVSVSAGTAEVHVYEGQVRCESKDHSQPVIWLATNQARRFQSKGPDQSVPLNRNGFVTDREALLDRADLPEVVESFAYADKVRGEDSGNLGWAGRWTGPPQRRGQLIKGKSLAWPSAATAPPGDGSMLITERTLMQRTLRKPIPMDQDGAHYFSFMLRPREDVTGDSMPGWGMVALRSPDSKKIAVGITANKMYPRMLCFGRLLNAPMKLKKDRCYLYVCKILSRREGGDQVFVRVYTANESVDPIETSTWSIATERIHDDSTLNQLSIVAKNYGNIEIDNIRIGETWSSVTSEYVP